MYKCKKWSREHDPKNCSEFENGYNLCKKFNHFSVECKNNIKVLHNILLFPSVFYV